MNFLYKEKTAISGQCAVTVVKSDRTCVAVLDACSMYPSTHLESVLQNKIAQNCRIFYTTAFFIGSNYDALKKMIEYASTNNFIVGFNFASEDMYINNK